MRTVIVSLACAACTVQSPAPVATHPAQPDSAGPSVPTTVTAPAPRGAVECSGQDVLELVDTTVDAVDAHGQCSLTIVRTRITGALEVHGRAQVQLDDSTVDGLTEVHGAATLSAAGSVFASGIERQGKGVIDDRGDNRW